MKSFQYLAPIAPFLYVRPSNLEELLDLLKTYGPKAKLIAGGTDLTIALKQRRVAAEIIIDLSALRSALGGISVKDGTLRIGSMTTYTELESNPLLAKFARAIKVAAVDVGTHQIRNLGTIGGNLGNASPAADLVPPLIALSAKVHLASTRGERVVPVEEFFAGVKKTIISPDEFISYVELPAKERVSSYFMRFAKRNENALSVVSVAVASEVRGEEFGESRVSLGSVAPTPILAARSSSALQGSRVDDETIEKVAALAREDSKPITDVRASADYRRQLVYVLTKRTISKMLEAAGEVEQPDLQVELSFRLNGSTFQRTTAPNKTLCDFLHDDAGLTGTKKGCDTGECGVCTVLVDGHPVTSCLVLAPQVSGREVTTIEGIGDEKNPHPIQEAFMELDAAQCGYCIPGVIVTLFVALKDFPDASEEDIRRRLSGNLCRCTGYQQQIEAVTLAAKKIKDKSG